MLSAPDAPAGKVDGLEQPPAVRGDQAFHVSRDPGVTGLEVFRLRQAMGAQAETPEVWDKCIAESLCTVTARDAAGALLGVGFVVGNSRHAQLVDMSVLPEARRQGIGAALQAERIAFCRERGIRYVGLTRDPRHPWLRDMYLKAGFRDVDFAMWLEDSLGALDERPG